jgi:hypothetical protein
MSVHFVIVANDITIWEDFLNPESKIIEDIYIFILRMSGVICMEVAIIASVNNYSEFALAPVFIKLRQKR